MNLKRTVYHFAGKDYESTQVVEFKFHIQRISIQNFLAIELHYNRTIRNYVHGFTAFFDDHQRTTTDGKMKSFIVKCSAATLFCILEKLGKKEWSSIESMEMNIRKTELRAYDGFRNMRYNGIHVFDPRTKKMWLTSNSPKKIEGKQAIINGQLWRKYLTK